MLSEELDKKIEQKIGMIEEGLQYQIESLCNMLSCIDFIRYLLYLKEDFLNNKNTNLNKD